MGAIWWGVWGDMPPPPTFSTRGDIPYFIPPPILRMFHSSNYKLNQQPDFLFFGDVTRMSYCQPSPPPTHTHIAKGNCVTASAYNWLIRIFSLILLFNVLVRVALCTLFISIIYELLRPRRPKLHGRDPTSKIGLCTISLSRAHPGDRPGKLHCPCAVYSATPSHRLSRMWWSSCKVFCTGSVK